MTMDDQRRSQTHQKCFVSLGSSSIKVKDGSGAAYQLGAENLISAASSVMNGTLVTLLSILIWVFHSFTS